MFSLVGKQLIMESIDVFTFGGERIDPVHVDYVRDEDFEMICEKAENAKVSVINSKSLTLKRMSNHTFFETQLF